MRPAGLLGDRGAMDVLSSRLLLRSHPEARRVFCPDTLGLAIYREFGSGSERGTVFFLGGGFLELSGRAAAPAPGMALWLQVRELAAARRELGERGVRILREPRREPWGLLEMWIVDLDGVRICIVEVPGGASAAPPRPSSSTTARDLAALRLGPAARPRCGKALPVRWSCLGALWSRRSDLLSRSVEHGDDGALGLVPGRDHLGRRRQLHLAAVAL